MQTQIAKSDDTGCETKYLSANVAEKSSRASNQPYEFGPEIFVYVGSVNWCTGIARGGYAYFPATVAKLHGRLDTANFSGSGQIHIHDWSGSESVEKVSVDLTFMGDGDVTEQTNTSTHISPGYRLKARYKGLFRHAKVNGSVSVGNDITPIELSVGSMGETASMEMTVSK